MTNRTVNADFPTPPAAKRMRHSQRYARVDCGNDAPPNTTIPYSRMAARPRLDPRTLSMKEWKLGRRERGTREPCVAVVVEEVRGGESVRTSRVERTNAGLEATEPDSPTFPSLAARQAVPHLLSSTSTTAQTSAPTTTTTVTEGQGSFRPCSQSW